jgi:endonuclease G
MAQKKTSFFDTLKKWGGGLAIVGVILYALAEFAGIDTNDSHKPKPKPKKDPVVVNPKTTTTTKDEPNLPTDGKLKNYLPKDTGLPIIKHSYFTLGYSEKDEQASWVAYELDKKRLLKGGVERTDNFRPDPNVSTGSSSPSDYSASGYDRGHLCPAGDMAFNENAMSETFFMSNMSPQIPACNRGIWKELEEQVRDWTKINGHLYVVTGPVLALRSLKKIGKQNKINVPKMYYKVLLDYSETNPKAIGFLVPNAASNEPLENFAKTVDEVESLTGLDFFPDLPNNIENKLESSYDIKKWATDKKRYQTRLQWTNNARMGSSLQTE